MKNDPEELAERRERIAELARNGWDDTRIARELALSTRTVLRYRHRLGLPVREQSPRLSASEIDAAQRLLDDGCSYGEVARTLGRCRATITKHFPGYEMSPAEGGRIAQLTVMWNRFERELDGHARMANA
jgi:hypothetical protein